MDRVDTMKDIFGRSRHSYHRDDYAGLGTFQNEGRILFIQDIKIPTQTPEPVEHTKTMLHNHFTLWGQVEEVLFFP